MIYEMRIYTVRLGMMKNYLEHFETIGLPIISKYSKLIGFWCVETGELNQIIHIWEYESVEDLFIKRIARFKDKDFIERFMPLATTLVEKQESRILTATIFSPIK
jgi:hypothetical protein